MRRGRHEKGSAGCLPARTSQQLTFVVMGSRLRGNDGYALSPVGENR